MTSKLPDKKSEIKTEIYQYHWLIYGHPKVGKTTFAAEFNNPLFICTEDRHKHLKIFKTPEEGAITSWREFKDTLNNIDSELKNGTFKWKTVVIDTIDNAYKFCREYTNKKMGIEHESDIGFGKGWEAIKTEFFSTFSTLTSKGERMIFISHAQERTLNDKVVEYHKIMPSLETTGRKVILKLVDIIGYVGFSSDSDKKDKRVLYLQGTETLEAGCATSQQMPAVMDLNYKVIEEEFKKRSIKNVT
jgi:hypothetical protein